MTLFQGNDFIRVIILIIFKICCSLVPNWRKIFLQAAPEEIKNISRKGFYLWILLLIDILMQKIATGRERQEKPKEI